MATKKFYLPESEMPTHWYNIAADLKNPPSPPLHPATHQPIGPEALAPLFPMELIKQEVSTERYIAIPEEVREIYKIWRPIAAHPRHRPGKGARYARQDLLQVRRRLTGRFAQAEHRRPAGVLQQAGRREADRDRDWRRPMGFIARICCQPLRHRGEGLHGEDLLQPEAVPPLADAGLGWLGCLQPKHRHELRPPGAGRRPGYQRFARHRHQRSRRRCGHARGHEVLARQRPQPRPPPPDRHRPGSDQADGDGRRVPGRHHRLRGRRFERGWPDVPVPQAQARWRPPEHALPRGRARARARA